MKNYFYILTCLLLVLSINSCDKEPITPIEPESPEAPKILFNYTVASNYLGERDIGYFWVTDSLGEIIAVSKLENGIYDEIMAPEGYNEQRYTLHSLIQRLTNIYSPSLILNSYSDINLSSIQFANKCYGFICSATAGKMKFHFSDNPIHDYYMISFGNHSNYNDKMSDFEEIRIGVNSSVYFYLRNGSVGYYKDIDGLGSGEIKELSINDFSTNMTSHTIHHSNNNYMTDISVYKRNTNFIRNKLYSYSGEKLTSDIFHLPNKAQYHNTYLDVTSEDKNITHKYYSYVNTGILPSTIYIPTINADIQVNSFDIENLKLQSSGDFDVFVFQPSKYDDFMSWTFLGTSAERLSFPKIPQLVKDDNSISSNKELFFSSFNDETYILASVYKLANQNYDDIIKRELSYNKNGYYYDYGSRTGVSYRLFNY